VVGYPWPGRVYQLEADEWANLTADVSDNVQIERVEFYLDDRLLDFSVVEPYSVKWVLAMSDTIPISGTKPITEVRPITQIQPITGPPIILPEGSWITEVVTLTAVQVNTETKTITQTWASGKMIISSTHGYTESHVVHIIAYDAAGNEMESEKVRFYIIHKPKEKEEEGEGAGESGHIWRRKDGLAAVPVDERRSAWLGPLEAGRSPPWWGAG
jgi:hypothetical protein